MKPSAKAALGLTALLALAACQEDAPKAPAANPDITVSAGLQSTTRQTEQPENISAKMAFILTMKDIPLKRDGKVFTADTIAYCGDIAEDFNPEKSSSLDAYKDKCTARVTERLQRQACTSMAFLSGTATNKPAIRGYSMDIPAENVAENLLWTTDNIKHQLIHDYGYETLTLTNVSDLDAANTKHFRSERPSPDCNM